MKKWFDFNNDHAFITVVILKVVFVTSLVCLTLSLVRNFKI